MAEPVPKKQKVSLEGEAAAPAEKATSATKKREELELDARVDGRPKLKEPVVFHPEETTLNVLPSVHGGILAPLTDGGLQYLLAGARANVGISAGRYMFEVKIVELLRPGTEQQAANKNLARNLLRVGLSVAGGSLFLGDTEQNVCFDIDGGIFVHDKRKVQVREAKKIGRDQVFAIVLNVGNDDAPNANTVSLFRDGQRLSDPQQLPKSFRGKALYPALTFKNCAVHCNFGPSPLAPLPFKCRMWQDSAQRDAKAVAPTPPPRDGKHEVLFPVCLPDEGTFDWLDWFLENNPQYTELSDRSIVSWAEKSGVMRQRGYGPGSRSSNDKPEMMFGLHFLDDNSVRRLLSLVAPLHNRNYVVMEVKGNLLPDERRELAARWPSFQFRRVALVLVGEPPAALKQVFQDAFLRQKQEVLNAEHKAKRAEAVRRHALELRKRELERAKKQTLAEDERKRRAEELEKRRKEGGEEPDALPEQKEAEPEEDKSAETEPPPAPPEEEPIPMATLSEEENKLWFKKNTPPDLTMYHLSAFFSKFALPERDEGFEEVRYEWQKQEACKEYLKTWVQERKLITRVEDISPSEWFTTKLKEWQRCLQVWHAKLQAYKAALQKRAEEKLAKEAALKAKKEQASAENAASEVAAATTAGDAEKKAENEKKEDGEKKEGEEGKKEAEEEKKVEPAEDDEAEAPKEEEAEVDSQGLDVFAIEDILDVGGGQPLFSRFSYEDWTMLSLRFEMHLLVHAFRHDVNDPDRVGIHLDHIGFYYQRYYKKQLSPKFYGVDSVRELMDLVRDCVVVARNQVVEAQLPDHLESLGIFAMLTEEARRDRVRRIDLGDETARLKVMPPHLNSAAGTGTVQLVHPQAIGATANSYRPVVHSVMAQQMGMATSAAGFRPTQMSLGGATSPTAGGGMQPGGWQRQMQVTSGQRQPHGMAQAAFRSGPYAQVRPYQPTWRPWAGMQR